MVAELVVAFTDPGSFRYSGAAASLLLDGGICSGIERQQDQPSADFSNHRVLIDFGKYISVVFSPSHEKHSA